MKASSMTPPDVQDGSFSPNTTKDIPYELKSSKRKGGNTEYGFNGQQSYDALHLPGLTFQPQPMTSIPAAVSSKPFTIILNSDEQIVFLRRMRKMRLISDSST
jgi:hypothetical protein